MSERSIEFESTINGWKVTIASPTTALLSELAALDPEKGTRERVTQLLTRIIQQLSAVLRTATRMEQPSDDRSLQEAPLTADAVTLEEAAHILQAVRSEQVDDPNARLFWLKDERILSFCSRGMGEMQLGALLAYAKRLENMRR